MSVYVVRIRIRIAHHILFGRIRGARDEIFHTKISRIFLLLHQNKLHFACCQNLGSKAVRLQLFLWGWIKIEVRWHLTKIQRYLQQSAFNGGFQRCYQIPVLGEHKKCVSMLAAETKSFYPRQINFFFLHRGRSIDHLTVSSQKHEDDKIVQHVHSFAKWGKYFVSQRKYFEPRPVKRVRFCGGE